MSLTFGYDLKDGDKILESSNQFASMMRPLIAPARGALVNILPFGAVAKSLHACSISWPFFSAPHPFMGPILQLRTISPV
jgi:hypothetical protein